MRMWMIDPKLLCKKHLLGEHNEIHKHRHNFVKKHSVKGRIEKGQIEPISMFDRHEELVKEMKSRGYNHKSDYSQPDISHLTTYEQNFKVDKSNSIKDLTNRCEDCRKLILKNKEEGKYKYD